MIFIEVAKKLEIDFIYLDLSTCKRCIKTVKSVHEVLDNLKELIRTKTNVITLNMIYIPSYDDNLAKNYDFKKSPTIRINGRDIQDLMNERTRIKSVHCQDCSKICQRETECRVFEYKGRVYNSPPKDMIREAIVNSMKLI